MSLFRGSFLKYLILLMLCIKSLHTLSHSFNLLDETSIVLNLDSEDTESEEKLELKEFNKITQPIKKNPLFLVHSTQKSFDNNLQLYSDHVADYTTPPPEIMFS